MAKVDTTPSAISAPLFTSGDVIEYAIESSEGKVIGRVHSRYEEAARSERSSRAWRAADHRTVEYATTMGAKGPLPPFKRLSSVDGRMTLSFETNGITRDHRSGDRAARAR